MKEVYLASQQNAEEEDCDEPEPEAAGRACSSRPRGSAAAAGGGTASRTPPPALEGTPRDPKRPRQFWVGSWRLYSGARGVGGAQTRKRRVSRVQGMPSWQHDVGPVRWICLVCRILRGGLDQFWCPAMAGNAGVAGFPPSIGLQYLPFAVPLTCTRENSLWRFHHRPLKCPCRETAPSPLYAGISSKFVHHPRPGYPLQVTARGFARGL